VHLVPLFTHEVLGRQRLEDLAQALYPNGEDPAAVLRLERPYTFEKLADHWEVRVNLPFTSKGDIGVFKKSDELVLEIGTLRRHIGLPTSMAALEPTRARLTEGKLIVELRDK
jgi:arsenite-transporting ATPase